MPVFEYLAETVQPRVPVDQRNQQIRSGARPGKYDETTIVTVAERPRQTELGFANQDRRVFSDNADVRDCHPERIPIAKELKAPTGSVDRTSLSFSSAMSDEGGDCLSDQCKWLTGPPAAESSQRSQGDGGPYSLHAKMSCLHVSGNGSERVH